MKNKKTLEIIKAIQSVVGPFNKKNPIALHEPHYGDTNAIAYVNDCINSGWVSSSGNWVNKFENAICKFTGSKYAIAVTNGTVGLRLALHIAGVREDDEVLIPPLSFVATANSISHLKAIPHFIDIEPFSLGMCPISLETRLNKIGIIKNGNLYNIETGRKISAIVPVDVFGIPCQIKKISEIAKKWNLPIIEDAAEALGSSIFDNNKLIHCGLKADIAVLSFNGNKIISTGGGGVLITNNSHYAKLAKHLSTTAKITHKWKLAHDQIGWNDRMPNINAALGMAQLENINQILENKNKLNQKYKKAFKEIDFIEIIDPFLKDKSNNWLITFRFKKLNQDKIIELRNDLLEMANSNGLFIRPAWELLNSLPFYEKMPGMNTENANNQVFRLVNLPSSPQLIDISD